MRRTVLPNRMALGTGYCHPPSQKNLIPAPEKEAEAEQLYGGSVLC